MPELNPLKLLLPAFALSFFWSSYVVLQMIWRLLRIGPSQFFYVKKRDTRPAVLDDPSYGTHLFARLKELKLHYVVSGPEDAPLMLFVHGFPEFWYSWRHQIKEFSKQYRCVAFDMRGYGDSDKPRAVSNYTMEKLTNDIKELIPALGYEKCILVSHDWGGAVAWDFAWRNPDMVDKLIVCNSPNGKAFAIHRSKSRSQTLKSWYMFFFQMPLLPELYVRIQDFDFIRMAFVGADWGAKKIGAFLPEDVEAFKYNASQTGALTGPINYYRAAFRYTRSQYTTDTVKVPTLIVWGTADGALEKEMAALSAQFCDDCTIQYIDGASHWVQQDEPEKTNTVIKEFLKNKS